MYGSTVPPTVQQYSSTAVTDTELAGDLYLTSSVQNILGVLPDLG